MLTSTPVYNSSALQFIYSLIINNVHTTDKSLNTNIKSNTELISAALELSIVNIAHDRTVPVMCSVHRILLEKLSLQQTTKVGDEIVAEGVPDRGTNHGKCMTPGVSGGTLDPTHSLQG